MKKTLYILSALLLGLVACNKTEFGMMDQPKADETGKVAVTMQLQVPVPLQAYTKANNMADTPNIDTSRWPCSAPPATRRPIPSPNR